MRDRKIPAGNLCVSYTFSLNKKEVFGLYRETGRNIPEEDRGFFAILTAYWGGIR
jgi:hypothetical protein